MSGATNLTLKPQISNTKSGRRMNYYRGRLHRTKLASRRWRWLYYRTMRYQVRVFGCSAGLGGSYTSLLY